MADNPAIGIEFSFSDDPAQPCDCKQILFSIGAQRIKLTAKRHIKDQRANTFPWEAGTIALVSHMILFKLQAGKGAAMFSFRPDRRGTMLASAYDVIETANWLPKGFGYKATNGEAICVFLLRQLTKEKPKKVRIQIDSNLLPAKNVCFYRGEKKKSLTQSQLKALLDGLAREWRERQRPSENALLNKSRKVTARRLNLPADNPWIPPPALIYGHTPNTLEGKINLLRQDMLPLFQACEGIVKDSNLDAYLQIVEHLAVLHFEKGHHQKALRYAKIATRLGEQLGDSAATELGTALDQETQKRLSLLAAGSRG